MTKGLGNTLLLVFSGKENFTDALFIKYLIF